MAPRPRLAALLGAFRTVKASGSEPREAAVLEGAATRAWSEGVRVAKWNALAGTSSWLAIQVAFLAVLGVGGARIGDVQRLDIETTASPPSSRTPDARQAARPEQASVAFRDVRFRYRDDLPLVHHGVSFELPARGMTAFVGPSGAGKTTVFSLIERFYEPESGAVLVEGRDVRDWPLDELRAAIGYVEQDAPVLAGTLRDNLRFAAPDATDAEILDVVALTRLDPLLDRLPDGLDTVVGHRGSTLSGGERQRIAIARALLRRPRLLLLDEATSQLDAVNELALRETVADLARQTTVLVVAHRLSTVTMADRIVVMDAGQVRAVGTHAELVNRDALYRELAATQLLTVAAGDPSTWHYYAVEHAVENAKGIEWTFLRAGEFMNNMLDWADTIRAEGVVRAAYEAAAYAPIDLGDIAAVAAKTLLTDGHHGAKYVLTGPESLSKFDRVRIIGEAIGRDIRFKELTHEDARAYMISRGYGDAADWLLDGDALAIDHPQLPDPTVAMLLGRPARTFAEWAADNADRFR